MSLPLSLGYHAGGLKVQDAASWVGAGWSLDAGGVITRSIKGGPDEAGTNMGGLEDYGHFSHYGYNSYFSGGGQQQDWGAFAGGRKDGEPDLYFFNFNGHSGKFYFRDDRTPVVVPEQDLKIEYYFPVETVGAGSATDFNIQGFIITTPEGEKYYFGKTAGFSGTAPVEVSNTVTDKSGYGNSSVISAWYLQKIASADNQFEITFDYVSETYGYFTTSMFQLEGNSTENEYNLVKNILRGVRLSQINFPGGTVYFNGGDVRQDLTSGALIATDTANSSSRTLGSIQISNGGNFCKKYKFSYGYFYDGSSNLTGYYNNSGYNAIINTDRYRLRLDTLREISCDSSIVIPPHVFTYFSEQVPRMLSFGIDHWGFSNGETGNNKLIPSYTVYDGSTLNTYPGANRDAAWPAMRAGSLKKITYPTGGYTELEFEPHDIYTSFSQYQSTSRLGMSFGFDGTASSSTTSSLTGDGNPMQLTINNSMGVYDASIVIKDGSNTVVYSSGYVSGGNTFQYSITGLTSGTYSVTLTISNSGHGSSGHGASVNFSQWVYTTVSGNTMVGGLRIKSITHHDGVAGNDIVTNYSYTNAGSHSTGILYSKPVYVQIIRNDLMRDLGYYNGSAFDPVTLYSNGCVSNATYFKSPSTIRPMESTQGNHIGYSSVKVSQAGNGYSLYGYYTDNNNTYATFTQNTDVAVRNITTGCSSDIPNYPAAPLPFDSKRGELYYEQHYDNSGQLVKDAYYYPNYETVSDAGAQTPGFAIGTLSISGATKYFGTFYSLGTMHKTSMVTTATEYSGGNGITTVTKTDYNSPYHFMPTRKATVNSTGDSLVSRMVYAFDFRVTACDTISSGFSAYAGSCAGCLSTYNSSRTSCGADASCLTTAYLTYAQCLTDARVSLTGLRKANFTNASNVYAANHAGAKSAADGELKPILQLQDQFENALIEKSDWKNGYLLSGNYTKYDYMANPSGYVYPKKVRAIELLNPSGTFTAASTSSNNQSVTSDSRYADLASFSFNHANLAHIIQRDGVPESYLWDYNNQYTVAKMVNATDAQVAYSSFESDGTGNWDYTSAGVRSGSGSVTGSKAYQLSSGYNIQRTALDAARTYVLTYWLKLDGGTVSIDGGGGGTLLMNTNDWNFYSKEISGENTVTISGTGLIDELRLFPKNAQMTTFTYDPLMGITSQCDVNNRIMYYEYDKLGRLLLIRDHDRNILKKNIYTYQETQ